MTLGSHEGSCLAQPAQAIIPGCTAQDLNLGMGLCRTLEGGKLNNSITASLFGYALN